MINFYILGSPAVELSPLNLSLLHFSISHLSCASLNTFRGAATLIVSYNGSLDSQKCSLTSNSIADFYWFFIYVTFIREERPRDWNLKPKIANQRQKLHLTAKKLVYLNLDIFQIFYYTNVKILELEMSYYLSKKTIANRALLRNLLVASACHFYKLKL